MDKLEGTHRLLLHGRVSFPDANFLIDHSGFVTTVAEQAYDPSGTRDGIDTPITSLRRHDVQPGSNVHFRTHGPKTRGDILGGVDPAR